MKKYPHIAALAFLTLAGAGCRSMGPEPVGEGAAASAAAEPLPGGRLQVLVEKTRCYASLPRRAHRP
ncbi:MAG: hypothetical protein WCG22_05250, partial [Lentisphaerota bacterium]